MNRWRTVNVAMAASILTLSMLGVGNAAFASDSDTGQPTATPASGPAETVPDRVIDKSSQLLNLPFAGASAASSAKAGAPSVTVTPGTPAIPADEQPRVGETVKVVYADANVVHQSITAACTVTGTAGTPYLSGRTARAEVSYYQNGCTGVTSASGDLYMYWGFDWWNLDDTTVANPRNGSTWTFGLVWACNNYNTSTFHSTAENAYSGQVGQTIVTVSNNKALACGR